MEGIGGRGLGSCQYLRYQLDKRADFGCSLGAGRRCHVEGDEDSGVWTVVGWEWH